MDSGLLKIVRGTPRSTASKALRSQRCRRGNVSWPENCPLKSLAVIGPRNIALCYWTIRPVASRDYLKSTLEPAFFTTASSNEALSRMRVTTAATRSAATSTSAGVLKRPNPTRIVLAASESVSPNANRTCEGCKMPALHAAFVESAMSGCRAPISRSASQPRKGQAEIARESSLSIAIDTRVRASAEHDFEEQAA